MSFVEVLLHPDCKNASNLSHECSDYCFKVIAEARARMTQNQLESERDSSAKSNLEAAPQQEEEDVTKLTGRKKQLWELRMRRQKADKDNQREIVAEKKRMEPPEESSRGISQQKWFEGRQRKLDAHGLDMKRAYMLDTQEMAEEKYKRWRKEPAPSGWDVFNSKTLYNAHKKRTKNVQVDLEEYNKMKEEEPFSCLQYGTAPKVSEDKVDKMVQELKDQEEKKKKFSRRRRFHDEKDIDSINDRNEHFNKKIERAFGKYTLEIKNNLERGTALPD
ncbi:hypothetical protein M0R45_036696 [Rubus argutus]|uniref:Pre-mRNA-splicing factor SYF2 n=1 Tax=Rubus argutus TaxID=59490 RepID=A0AAW1W1C1_RUBAR